VETAFKAGTVDTGSASALQGTDLASSILHQLRQHLTAPVSARARGVCRSVSAWGPPPAVRFIEPGAVWDLHRWRRGDCGSTLWDSAWHSFAERRAQATLASASQVPKPVSFAVRSHLALTVMSRSTRA